MNETLRRAIFSAGLSEDDVASQLGVDPKTVRRWVDGRLPYPRLRWQLAAILGTDEIELWPDLRATRAAATVPTEVIAIYPHRWSVPRDAWRQLFDSAIEEIIMLADSSLFIAEDAALVRLLHEKANSGVSVRIALTDPDSRQGAERGSHEMIDAHMAAEIREALSRYQPLSASPRAEIRFHHAELHNSIYGNESELLVSQHVYGVAVTNSPVLHLRGSAEAEIIANYLASFEHAWSKSVADEPGRPFRHGAV